MEKPRTGFVIYTEKPKTGNTPPGVAPGVQRGALPPCGLVPNSVAPAPYTAGNPAPQALFFTATQHPLDSAFHAFFVLLTRAFLLAGESIPRYVTHPSSKRDFVFW